MRLHFFGAAGEVTGSCTLVETSRARVLVDFGTHQGGPEAEARNRRVPGIEAPRLDAVVLTHAHIDHCGRLPLLPRLGYKGRVWCTPATRDIAGIMLRDSAKLQADDAARATRKRARRGRPAVEPIYGPDDVERFLPSLEGLAYDTEREIAPGVKVVLHESGHILGAASVELRLEDGSGTRRVVFSGDVGPLEAPLVRRPDPPREADVVVLESTYGDREHKDLRQTLDELARVLRRASEVRGRVIVPAFALGRTQDLIWHLAGIYESGKAPRVPVYIDSPMAIAATELYRKHKDVLGPEARGAMEKGALRLAIPELRFLRTGDESRAINELDEACVVIAASGMCTGGRVLHHLKHHLWKERTHVVITGFQARGSLGRRLVERQERVMVLGDWVFVRAGVHTLGGFSAHAGQGDLASWAGTLAGSRPRVLLNHGEDVPRAKLAERLAREHGLECDAPGYGEVVEF